MVIWHAIFRERCCHDQLYGVVPLIYSITQLYSMSPVYACLFIYLLAFCVFVCLFVCPAVILFFSSSFIRLLSTFLDLFWLYAEFPIRSRQTIESVSLCLSDISWLYSRDCFFSFNLFGSPRFLHIKHGDWCYILLLMFQVSTLQIVNNRQMFIHRYEWNWCFFSCHLPFV